MLKSLGKAAFSWQGDTVHFWKLMTTVRNKYPVKWHFHDWSFCWQWHPSPTETSPGILDVLSQALEMHPQNLWGGLYSSLKKSKEGTLQGHTSVVCVYTHLTPQLIIFYKCLCVWLASFIEVHLKCNIHHLGTVFSNLVPVVIPGMWYWNIGDQVQTLILLRNNRCGLIDFCVAKQFSCTVLCNKTWPGRVYLEHCIYHQVKAGICQ